MIAQQKTAVSLCMIVRNEEQNLAECLSPIAVLFDEIVIIDTGSQDQTRQVARRFTPHVYDFPWCDDFAAARNESLRRASGDWIFWLDADDRLTSRATGQLQALLHSLNGRPQVFFMNTVVLNDSADGATLVTHPRLFPRHPSLQWQGRVHEQLGAAPSVLHFESVFNELEIEHHGYLDQKLRHRKLRRNLRLLCMDHAVNPEDPSVLLHLGQTHLGLGNMVEAREYLLRAAAASPPANEPLRPVFAFLAALSLHEGKFAESLEFATRGLALFPRDEHFLYAQALALFEGQNYAAAACAAKRILDNSSASQFHFGASANIKHKLAPHLLGVIHFVRQQYAAAEATFQLVVRDSPDYTTSWYSLGLVYIATGDRRKLESVLAALEGCPGGRVDALLLAARWELKHGQLDQVGPLIDHLIAQAPQLPCPRILRFEWLSRCHAPVSAQLQALQDVLRVDPGNAVARRAIMALRSPLRAATNTAPAAPPTFLSVNSAAPALTP